MNVRNLASAALIAVITTTTISVANAQDSYKMGFTFGSNYSSLRSDLYTTASGRLSAAAGFSIALGFGEHFELNPEIMFVQKGATAKAVSYNPENLSTVTSYDFHYNSFEAGVFAGYKPVANLPITFQAGGFFGTHFHNLNNKQDNLYVGDYENVVEAIPVTNLNESLTGIDFGPAVGISAGAGRFRVNARYYLGMRNLYNNIAFAPEGHSIKTSSIRLTMTYFFKDRSTMD